MRLKRIEMAGFKSFVDPTRIELGDGITVIVGPNGCGKSNVIDAVRWVLGEHSARQLRGGIMDDLIFQGSATRSRVSLCDVELTFTAEAGQLPAPYHEFTEISVRRRMTREAGSDAYINGKMVRLKDIVDLFLDTGISSHAYAIVEQGSISRMITAKPEERRLILEEAAGIMKYRTRRCETERKMGNTRQNLERVIDLLEEVRSQCRSLRQQASRAERFKTMQDEFQEYRAVSMGMRYLGIQEECTCIEREYSEAGRSGELLGNKQAGMERELNGKREQLVRYEAEVQAVQDEVRASELHQAEIQRSIEELAGKRRLLEERRGHLEQRLTENRVRVEHLAAKLSSMEQQTDEVTLTVLMDKQNRLKQEVVDALERSKLTSQQRDRALADLERLKSEQASYQQRRQHEQFALQHLIERQQAIRARLGQISGQSAKVRERYEQVGHARELAEQASAHSGQEQSRQKDAVEFRRKEKEKSETDLNTVKSRVHQLAGEIEEISARIATDDIDGSLRSSLREMGLQWMDEALQVPEGFELAVAAVLRGQSADAFCPDRLTGDSLRQLRNIVGGAPVAIFTGHAGVPVDASLALAMGLEREHPLYPLFSAITLVADITSASEAAAEQPQCMAVVSRDGWLMGSDGWLVAPCRQHAAHKLELKRRLSGLEQQFEISQRQFEEVKVAFEQAESALLRQQSDWEEAHLAGVEVQGVLAKAAADCVRLQAELDNFEGSREHLDSELSELAVEEQRVKELLSAATEIDPELLAISEQKFRQFTDARQDDERSLTGLRTNLAAVDRELALYRQAETANRIEKKRCEEEKERNQSQINEDEKRLSLINSDLASNGERLSMDKDLAAAVEDVNGAYLSLNQKREAGHQLQQQVWDTEQQLRKLQKSFNQEAVRRQQIQLRLTSEQTRLEGLTDRIRHQCHVEVETLLESLRQRDEMPDTEEVIRKADQLEDRLSRFGPVNLLAIDEYRQASEREGFLSEQSADLEASLQTMADTISRIDRTTRQRFQRAFEQTNALFRETFPRLFGGGRAELKLDSEDLLNAGVDIIAQPPGKRLQDIGLLSGGEKALTAVALVFSIFRMKPAPFCILDEVDAPLDEANIGRFGELMRELSSDVQFINITHNRVSMQLADHLIGVSMPEPGVSRIVGVELDR